MHFLLQHNRDANQPTNMGIQPAAAPAMPPMMPEAPPSRIIRCLFCLVKFTPCLFMLASAAVPTQVPRTPPGNALQTLTRSLTAAPDSDHT